MTRTLAITIALAASVGCGGTSYEKDVESTFTRSCAAVQCHADASTTAVDTNGDTIDLSGLDLSRGNGYDSLVDQPAGQSSLNLIEPEDPDGSYLWHKINDTHGPHDLSDPASEPMPPGTDRLSVDDLVTIEAWILDGAKR